MRTGYVFLLFANRIFTEQETTNIVEDKHHHHQQQKQHVYLPHTMYFLFSFSLFFTLYRFHPEYGLIVKNEAGCIEGFTK